MSGRPGENGKPILEVRKLKKHFPITRGILRRVIGTVRAVDQVTFTVTQGTTIDSYVSRHAANADILRFPSNSETVAAFQSDRADAASLFHPPLIALQKKIGKGTITLPDPIRPSASSAGVRKEADKTWRDWVGTAIGYYYNTGQSQLWFDEFLVSFEVDPATVPPIMKELW